MVSLCDLRCRARLRGDSAPIRPSPIERMSQRVSALSSSSCLGESPRTLCERKQSPIAITQCDSQRVPKLLAPVVLYALELASNRLREIPKRMNALLKICFVRVYP